MSGKYNNQVELSRLNYLSQTENEIMQWNDENNNNSNGIGTSQQQQRNSYRVNKIRRNRNNAILTDNDDEDDDEDLDEAENNDQVNDNNDEIESGSNSNNSSGEHNIKKENNNLRRSLLQPTRYQKLGEVDSSLLLYDSDDDENDSNHHNPFRHKKKRQSSKSYKHNGVNNIVTHNLETISGFFIYIYHTIRYTLFADFQVAIRYVHKNSKKNLKSILMGLLTVFLVVMFISFLQNLIQASPIVFLKLSEDQAGEWDLLVTGQASSMGSPTNNNTLNSAPYKATKGLKADPIAFNPAETLNGISQLFLNSTVLTKKLASASMVHGVAPRWLSLASMKTPTNVSASLIMLVMNSTLEHNMGLGRGWDHAPLVGNQVHISSAYLRRINVEPNKNQSVNLHVDFIDVLERLGSTAVPTLDQVQQLIANYIGMPIPGTVDISLEITILKFRYPNIVNDLRAILGDGISSNGYYIYPPIIIGNFYNRFRQELVIDQSVIVMDAIDSPGGKYPSSLGNVAVFESSYVNTLVKNKLESLYSDLFSNISLIEDILSIAIPAYMPQLNATELINQIESFRMTFGNFTNNFILNEYSMATIVMLENRVKIYTSKDPKNSLIAFTNQVAMHIGYSYPALFTTPLASALSVFKYTRLSLDQVFNCVAAVLLVLGALMIYSLLLSDVEGKTFEYGMLRAQGMRHYALIILLLTQALYFSVPGILFGLFFGWACFAIVAHFVYQFVMLPVDLTFYSVAIISGVLMGLCLPILANIAPIQRALSRTLRDALDVYHQVKNETMVKIMKLEEIGFDPLQTSLSILSVVVGFTVYYLIPLSFTFMNYSLFFAILTGILLGMLFGLAMLAQAVQSNLEKLICFLMIWGPDRRTLYNMVRKNLASHSGRNSKTATMFTICLTFIIFTGCVFRLQGYNIQELVKLGVGSDIDIVTSNTKFILPEAELRGFLNNELINNTANTAVESYSFVTLPLDRVMNIRSTYMNTLAGYPANYVKVYGVDSNYLYSSYINFLDVTATNDRLSFDKIAKKLDVVKSLYTNQHKDIIDDDPNGKITPPPNVISYDPNRNNFGRPSNKYIYKNYTDIILSDAFRLAVGASPETPFSLQVNFKPTTDNNQEALNLLAKPQSMVSMFPSFLFSSYSATASRSPVLISMDQFYETMNKIYDMTTDPSVILPETPPKSKLLIKLKAGTSQTAREYIVNGCKNFIKSDSINVLDSAFLLGTSDTAITLLNIFFYTVSATSIILCFFMLWVSFASNIHENSWEFGVLRAIGLTTNQVIRIYIYEALVLIFSSVILGLIIGLGVAVTLTLQLNLFTQLPFSFQFPYFLFFGVFIASIIMAIIVSRQASKEYSTKQIASVLKGK